MPKPMIETSVLLKLIKKYFEDECHNNIKRLRYSEITQYINRNGYPNYPATSLRRNKAAVDYITELRQTVSEESYVTTVSYQTIDAASLVDSNRSRGSLIKAITERDMYYKTIADSAAMSFKRYNTLSHKYEDESEKCRHLEFENNELKQQLYECKMRIKELIKDFKAYKAVVDTYVYPEIANELLAREGYKKKAETDIINQDTVDSNVITPSTDIRKKTKSGSSIIQGMFDSLE